MRHIHPALVFADAIEGHLPLEPGIADHGRTQMLLYTAREKLMVSIDNILELSYIK